MLIASKEESTIKLALLREFTNLNTPPGENGRPIAR
jgi:hypothetical protein